MELQLKIIGIFLIALSGIHLFFPKYFNWKEELGRLSLINRQMMQAHTFFLALFLFLLGILCLISTNDFIHTPLGRKISFGLGVFWFLRLVFQLLVYSSNLWKGKQFETIIHIFFSVLWIYFTGIFLWIAIISS